MKRALALLIAVLMVVLCCACGESEDSSSSSSSKKKTAKKGSNENNTPGTSETGDVDIADAGRVPTVTVDSGGFQDSIAIDAFSYPQVEPEYGTQPSTLDTAWDASASKKTGGTDAKAAARREAITNTANTLDLYKIKGRVYYVSPNGNDSNSGLSPSQAVRTLDCELFTMHKAKPGDAILFERNGVWRTTNAFSCDEGITYGSYGTGLKPAIYGSARNYANSEYWTPSNRQNVWKITVVDEDVGIVVCNHGEIVGTKRLNGVVTLEQNGDFYFNTKQDTMYFYCDKGNPGKAFKDIEIGVHKAIINVTNVSNVTIDNLRLKYTGYMGINMRDADNSVITNCEIGFVGGCIQSGTLRYGNGIQMWNEVDGHRIENCWIYQVYDAAVTWQGDNTYVQGFSTSKHDMNWWRENGRNSNVQYKNISYLNNLIELSTYSIEFWHGADTHFTGKKDANGQWSNGSWVDDSPTKWSVRIENFIVQNNICRLAGYGWGRQRPDHMGNHICVWRRPLTNVQNCKIINNTFDMSDSYIVYWQFSGGESAKAKGADKWLITNNTYYQGKNKFNQGMNYPGMQNASNRDELLSQIQAFDDNPTLYWIS